MKIRERENGKFVDFNDHTQVWRRPSKNRLRISTNDLYCQKLDLLTDTFAADSMGLHMSHGLLVDSVDASLASLSYSCKADAVLSDVHDQWMSRERHV